VKPLLAVADTVTGKESPAAMLMSTGEAASWKPGAGGAAAAVTVTPTPKVCGRNRRDRVVHRLGTVIRLIARIKLGIYCYLIVTGRRVCRHRDRCCERIRTTQVKQNRAHSKSARRSREHGIEYVGPI
jgi:hypothetical protein